MTILKPFLFALTCAWSIAASAQWQWIDKDGRKVFSDRAPPQEIAEKNILRKPHQFTSPARAATSPSAAAAAGTASEEAKPNAVLKPALASLGKGTDKELEERKAKAEAETAAKEKAEAQKLVAAKADNCARAKQAKTTLESGQLMKYTNSKGEQVYMDDAKRNAERDRAKSLIESNCTR